MQKVKRLKQSLNKDEIINRLKNNDYSYNFNLLKKNFATHDSFVPKNILVNQELYSKAENDLIKSDISEIYTVINDIKSSMCNPKIQYSQT